MDKILDVTEKTIEDLSIYSKELFPFKPITGTDYNSPGVIQINIEYIKINISYHIKVIWK